MNSIHCSGYEADIILHITLENIFQSVSFVIQIHLTLFESVETRSQSAQHSTPAVSDI